ncbi:MAG: AmmeMemoRadiSam system protein B [Pseudomonadales bacterium]
MTAISVRPPAVADMFYPGDPDDLAEQVTTLLAHADSSSPRPPKALIVPHAGYVYSGPIAANAYRLLAERRESIRRVVLLGPAHRVYLKSMAFPSADAFATPLGTVRVDRRAITAVLELPETVLSDAAHAQEHCLEVHLPFLQRALKDFRIVPFLVGDCAPDAVARVLEALWGGEETVILVSSDLSHYLPYSQARQVDAATTRQIEHRSSSLRGEEACGARAINALMRVAVAHDLRVRTLDVRNSGDTAGDRSRVVGYGAWALMENPADLRADHTDASERQEYDATSRRLLLDIARDSIAQGLRSGQPLAPDLDALPPQLTRNRATFVTIRRGGRLRGCIGSISACQPLALDVAESAFKSAFRDPRFASLAAHELRDLDIEISVLSPLARLPVRSNEELLATLVPRVDGLILDDGRRRAVFLPKVWESLPQAGELVAQLKLKGGWTGSYWSEAMRAYRFRSEEFDSSSTTT